MIPPSSWMKLFEMNNKGTAKGYRTIYNIWVQKYYYTSSNGRRRIRCSNCNGIKANAGLYDFLCVDCLKDDKLRKRVKKLVNNRNEEILKDNKLDKRIKKEKKNVNNTQI